MAQGEKTKQLWADPVFRARMLVAQRAVVRKYTGHPMSETQKHNARTYQAALKERLGPEGYKEHMRYVRLGRKFRYRATRRCVVCKEIKPLDVSNFFKIALLNPQGFTYHCRPCNSKIDSETRHKLKRKAMRGEMNIRNTERWNKNHPEKATAHALVKEAVRIGQLVRQPCEKCGNPKTHGHHNDYSKPLEVRWLCHSHHMQFHYELKLKNKTN